MYYVYSLPVSVFLFALIQYNEYLKDENKYDLYTVSNAAVLIFIYMIVTILMYMMIETDYTSFTDVTKTHKKTSHDMTNTISKISEPVYTGFKPPHL
tara:strand:+ start:193 stop:483 length:291 start_codon:yes stop_codon:yes gene_type:complete